MKDDEKMLTVDELRERVLEKDIDMTMNLLTCPWPPFVHLAPAASVKQSADVLADVLPGGLKDSRWTEHQELASAVEDAVKAANIAFDAALNAAWQFYWMYNQCKCARCTIRRTTHNARFQ